MKPESCSFTQNSPATSRPFNTRHVATRGLQCSASPARLLGQQQPCGTKSHASAVNVQKVLPRSLSSQASVAEAPTQMTAADIQHADRAAKSSSNRAKSQKPSLSEPSASQQSQLESLGLLEWPELCQQVSKQTCLTCVACWPLLCFALTQNS